MQFVLTETGKPVKKPGLPVMTIFLVILAHILFWQLLQSSNSSLYPHKSTDIHYLEFLQVPKPVVTEPVKTASLPVKPVLVKKPTNRPAPASRSQAARQVPEPVAEVTDKHTPPAPQASSDERPGITAPGLDLDTVRSSALAMERKRKPTEIEQMQASHRQADSLEKRLGEGTKRAEKKDCLKAFSGIGVLAVIPLVASTVIDTGCKW
ncbi:hypothetical protein [Undibacterium pigrum]|uniref:Uncharacterized protein n=1 Tax=Undibacterium pigrum TaxID=401470 RepID=A0A318JCI6_9BURK|nr:hypothetical protein [Undibacterium pigrum]PXX45316.1 hypothetical protein DFR42_102544 [Undibacterium pigrum]